MKFSITFLLAFTFSTFNCLAQNTVSIANDRMNVIYTGINNPLTIAAAGVKDKHLKVECKNLKIEKRTEGKYMVKASKPGVAEIIVFKKNKVLDTILFRVKRFPDPVILIGNKKPGTIKATVFRKQTGLSSTVLNFDYDINCILISFDIIYVPKGEDPVNISNSGPEFTERALEYIRKAAKGDYYYFENIMLRCPGDKKMRSIDGAVFKISNN